MVFIVYGMGFSVCVNIFVVFVYVIVGLSFVNVGVDEFGVFFDGGVVVIKSIGEFE